MRYIDADALTEMLTKKLKTDYEMGLYNHGALTESFVRFVERQPTADVVEVRHGEWKKAYEKAPRYVCTACNHLNNNKEYKYCPFCGARMGGERKEP